MFYLIISYFILYRIDNGNCYIGGRMECYIGGRMEIKIDKIQYWQYGGSGEWGWCW